MRRKLVFACTTLLLAQLFIACNSTDDGIECPEDHTGALAEAEEKLPGDWVLTAMTADQEIDLTDDETDNPSTDLFTQYEACQKEGVGMAVGSRYVKGGGFVNWSKYRLFLSYGASIYTRLITGMTVKDATAGFVMYKREVLAKMDLSKIEFIGYAFQIEMKYYCHSLGYKIAEVPITFVDRELGTSKMNSSIIKEAVWGVIKMRFRDYSN